MVGKTTASKNEEEGDEASCQSCSNGGEELT